MSVTCRLLALLLAVWLMQGFNCSKFLRRSIEKYGYQVELHNATTQDGYILTMARIPSPGKPVIFMVHQIFGCSVDYTLQGPDKSLAFIASDGGYDVWMGNVRGNMFSRSHVKLDPKEGDYWQYSFHEVGVYDLPAMIDYVLLVTRKQKLHYVGHSQGSVVFFVMTSMLPEYNRKVASAHLSAPVVFTSRMAISATVVDKEIIGSMVLLDSLGIYDVGGRVDNAIMDYVMSAHKAGIVSDDFILSTAWSLLGEDAVGFNRSTLKEIVKVFPAGGSIRQLIHFAQCYTSGRFQYYDYGAEENRKRYGHTSPPAYPLDLVTVPVALYYGLNDPLLVPDDVDLLVNKLSNVVLKYQHPNPKWNHIDFIYGIHAHRVYRRVLHLVYLHER